MGFADPYLQKQRSFLPAIETPPENDLQQVIVIPCFNEPEVVETLNSLCSCAKPVSSVEVLVVVNTPENASKKVKDLNNAVYESLVEWKQYNQPENIRMFPLLEKDLPIKYFGAGLARKTGMDEAVYRYNLLNRSEGIIVSLDADTICSENYLVEIEKHFNAFPAAEGCSIYFEHPVKGNEFDKKVYEAVSRYELYLRYYKQGLKWTGFPYAFHTVGSAFAVRAGAYVKYGGMNRRKGGEDFYFIHKITPHGKYRELNSTTVFPSPRPSDRVPFGTGASVKKQIQDDQELKTYCLHAFIGLKKFFNNVDRFYKAGNNEIDNIFKLLNKPVEDFLISFNFRNKITEISDNVATCESFRKRFFQKFDASFVVKYMNFVHRKHYNKIPVNKAAGDLLIKMGISKGNISDVLRLLEIYRKLDSMSEYW